MTNNLLIHNMLWNMNNNLVSMSEKQNQLSTGKRINKASDDPVGTTKIIKVKSNIVENKQYKNNVQDAKSWLEVSENSLTDIKNILQRVRELAVQGANGTNTQEDTDKIAQEIKQMTEEVIVNSNATIAGRYLFSGFQTDEKLLNEDGTYNINITSEKITDFESIAYEVTVGEEIQVGTNYIDVFGTVEENNVLTDTFVFGNVAAGESRVGTSSGQSATHTKLQGPVDYKKDMTSDTLEIVLDSVTFQVDSSLLTGSLDQKEYTDILRSAKQTSPLPTHPVPMLGDVAEIYFVESTDPKNDSGEMVIEAKGFGAIPISINDTGNNYTPNPLLEDGITGVAPVNASIQGNFDYSTDYVLPVAQTLTFDVGADTYTVDATQLNGLITETDFVNLIGNADDGFGNKLSDIMDISFVPTAGTQGTLNMVSKTAYGAVVSANDSAGGYTVAPTEVDGVAGVVAKKEKIDGIFDFSKDLSSNDLSYTIGGVTYSVDTSLINGSITEEALMNLIENAPQTFPVPGPPPVQVLSQVADIKFLGTTDPNDTIGRITIEALNAITSTSAFTDTGDAYIENPIVTDGISTIEPIKGKIEGVVDLSSNLTGETIQLNFGSKTYTVSTSALDGTLSAEDFVTQFENATDGLGGKLSDYMNVSFDPLFGTTGKITIEQNKGLDGVVDAVYTGSSFTMPPVKVDGFSGVISTKAIVTGKTEITEAMLSDPEKGSGVQTFVVTYNDQTATIDVNFNDISTIDEMKSAINEELKNVFGDDGGAPAINNVNFDVVYDGDKNVVQFTGSAKDDGSRPNLKVDVIKSKKSQLIQDLQDFSQGLNEKDDTAIDKFLLKVDDHLDNVLSVIADIGAKDNRMDFIESRIESNAISMTKMLSMVQDIDFSETIVKFKSLESIYRASLSAGAKVIQPTLVDFIK